ncbi:unnamed protein product [Albugo candida]|uniref:C3H1-type domain-containing protein n=1 Tax=Albugo candida TaxID=65357 RepID=A0A024GP81_9STRA|nr:unnamed protein product [Albugo candida]|eukprot:CCI48527.1 unnamed protein product [Albugo candida]
MSRGMSSAIQCRFYAQGNCRRGKSCNFSHSDFRSNKPSSKPVANSQPSDEKKVEIIINELSSSILYPYSGFAVDRGLPNAVDDDLSPEEIRFVAYEQIKLSGSCIAQTQSLQELLRLKQQQKSQVIALMKENGNARKLLLGGEKLSNVQTMSFSNNSFASGQKTAFSTQFGASASRLPSTQHQGSFQDKPSSGNPFASNALLTNNNSFQKSAFAGNNTFNSSANVNSGFSAFENTATGAGTTGFGMTAPSLSPFGVLPTGFGNVGGEQHGQTAQPASGNVNPFSSPSDQQIFQRPIATFDGNSEPADSMIDETQTSSSNEPLVPPTARTLFDKPASTPPVFQSKGVCFGVPSNLSFPSATRGPVEGAEGPLNVPDKSSTREKSIDDRGRASDKSHVAVTGREANFTNSQNAVIRDEAWNLKQYEASEFVLGMVPTVPPPMHLCR